MRKYIVFFNKFIFFTKKCYFFHYIVLFFLPFTLIFTLFFLSSPLQTIEEMSYDGYVLSLNFAIFFYYFLATIIAIFATLITMLFKFLFTHTITATSKFLLNNKYYNILYIYSLFLVIFIGLWLCK